MCAAVNQAADTATCHVWPPHDLDWGSPCTMDRAEQDVSCTSSSNSSSKSSSKNKQALHRRQTLGAARTHDLYVQLSHDW
jgi:hypothetical protein